MIRKSGYRFSGEIMLNQGVYQMEGVAGIVAPADGSFPGAGLRPAPASNLPVEYAPPPSEG
jgi:hypothetical protein